MRWINLFFYYFSQYVKTRLAYRSDFFVQLVSDLLFQAINLVFILVVFTHTSQLNGWSRDEVIFIYGYFLIPFSIFVSFFNLWDFNERYIIKGELDRVLARPVHSLYQIILETLSPESLVGVLTGIIVMGWAVHELNVQIAWFDPILFFFFVLGGVGVYSGIFIMLSSISLFSDSKTDIQPIMYNIGNYGRYPITVYHRIIQLFLTWILPFAFVGFYPASLLLDYTRWVWFALSTPFAGLIYFWLGIQVWNGGIRYYRGAGN